MQDCGTANLPVMGLGDCMSGGREGTGWAKHRHLPETSTICAFASGMQKSLCNERQVGGRCCPRGSMAPNACDVPWRIHPVSHAGFQGARGQERKGKLWLVALSLIVLGLSPSLFPRRLLRTYPVPRGVIIACWLRGF